MNRRVKLVSFFLISIVGSFFFWLVIKNFPFYDQFKIEMKLGQDTSLVSSLGPPPRVKIETDYQKILESPVYFDVRTLPWYKTAQIYLIYQEAGQSLSGLGGQTAPGFNYNVQKPIIVHNLADGWEKAVFEVNLNEVYQEKNFRRFLISTTQEDLITKGELKLKELKILLFK